eukprot:7158788-Prymnesium_polylepis.1
MSREQRGTVRVTHMTRVDVALSGQPLSQPLERRMHHRRAALKERAAASAEDGVSREDTRSH